MKQVLLIMMAGLFVAGVDLISAAGTGTLDKSSGWYPAGSTLTVTATPGQDSAFDAWSGDISGATLSGTTIVIPVDHAREVTAVFVDAPSPGELRDPENPSSTVAGIDWALYQGSWSVLPDFDSLTAAANGTTDNFGLGLGEPDNDFGYRFVGYVDVPTDGEYTFYTRSDDGSKLFIGATEVVDNDGLHGAQERNGTIGLKAGKHAIAVTMFERSGGQVLDVSWSGPGMAKQEIPAAVLCRDGAPPATGLKITQGVVANVDSGWQTVTLPETFASMVVVTTPVYNQTQVPAVIRVRNAGGNSFDIRAQNPGEGAAVDPMAVHYVAVEEGVYTDGEHGITMEAVRCSSTLTDRKNNWSGEPRSYLNSYIDPVVLGQVMSANDSAWSVFWARGASQSSVPDASALYVGKHVGEDVDTARADETIGYIVLESGSHTVGSQTLVAGVGSDSVQGMGNSPPFTYPLSGVESVSAAVLSSAGMDGGDGGWMVHEADPAPEALSIAVDEDQVNDSERSHTTEQAAYLVVVEEAEPGLKMTQGVVANVDSSWQTVTLPETFASMVVVTTPVYNQTQVPAVIRVRNAGGNSFEIRAQNPGDASTVNPVAVHYVAVEEGVYTEAEHGVNMEAVRYTSILTDENNSWGGEQRSYLNSYVSPVVIGQVMSANDPDWSVFWARGASRSDAPDASNLYVGKHVGEDPDVTRADETIGYIVVESGNYTIGNQVLVAGLGADSVRGIDNSPPFAYTLSGLDSVSAGVVSSAGMDGSDGGWVVHVSEPSISTLFLAVDEDQVNSSERSHTTEQAAYLVIGSSAAAAVVAEKTSEASPDPLGIEPDLALTDSSELIAKTPTSDEAPVDRIAGGLDGSGQILRSTLVRGLNLVCLPVVPEDNRAEALFGNFKVTGMDGNGQYVQAKEIEPGVGYWVEVSDKDFHDIMIEGASPDSIVILRKGWNLFGIKGNGLKSVSVQDLVGGQILRDGEIKAWDPIAMRYETVDQLTVGIGYAVFCTEEYVINFRLE